MCLFVFLLFVLLGNKKKHAFCRKKDNVGRAEAALFTKRRRASYSETITRFCIRARTATGRAMQSSDTQKQIVSVK